MSRKHHGTQRMMRHRAPRRSYKREVAQSPTEFNKDVRTYEQSIFARIEGKRALKPTEADLAQVREIKRLAVELATETNATMDGTIAPVLKILATHDLVFAVWEDRKAPDGVDMLIIKGQRFLLDGMAGQKWVGARMSAIKCLDKFQAMALCKIHGESDPRN